MTWPGSLHSTTGKLLPAFWPPFMVTISCGHIGLYQGKYCVFMVLLMAVYTQKIPKSVSWPPAVRTIPKPFPLKETHVRAGQGCVSMLFCFFKLVSAVQSPEEDFCSHLCLQAAHSPTTTSCLTTSSSPFPAPEAKMGGSHDPVLGGRKPEPDTAGFPGAWSEHLSLGLCCFAHLFLDVC